MTTTSLVSSTLTTDDIDYGEQELFDLFSLIERKEPHVAVGVMGEKKYIKEPGGGGTVVPPSIVDVAIFQEFGTVAQVTPAMRNWFQGQGASLSPTTTEIKVPARSYMRSTVDENMNDIIKVLDKQLENILDRKVSIYKGLSIVGTYVQGLTQAQFEKGNFEDLSEFTTQRKGSTKPLIDTGRLRQSISYQVRFGK